MVSEDAGVCIGDANRNPYGEAALELYRRGLFPIPCGGDDGKQPTGIKGWQRMKRPPRMVIERLAVKHAALNVGAVMGAESRCTVIDVDEPAHVDLVHERFGDSPLITRTPRGGVHLWYRHDGEGCGDLRGEGLNVDVKGQGGQVIVPPSYNRVNGRPYEFMRGSWDDLARLPKIRGGGPMLGKRLEPAPTTGIVVPVATIAEGKRNNTLFKKLLREAKTAASQHDLLERAYELNAASCNPPLPTEEVGRIATRVWTMQAEGQNWSGKEQRVFSYKREVEALAAQPHGGDAFLMLAALKLAHEAHGKPFAIAPKAMSRARVLPWSVERLRKARDTLQAAGCVRLMRRGGRRAGDAHQFQLALPGVEGLQNPTQYNVTPSPLRPPAPPVVPLGGAVVSGGASAIDEFGAKVRAERERRGLRQIDVAAKAGIARPTLANIEAGRFSAGAKAREGLRAVLGVAA